MILRHRVLTAFVLLLTLHDVLSNRTDLPRYKLHDRLFTGYNKNVRPVNDTNDSATEVYVSFNIHAFVNLDERQQTMSSIGVLYMQWMDETLQWDPEEHGQAQTLIVNQEDIWVPDINVRNTVIPTEQLGYERGPVLVESSGNVTWQPHCVFETLCSIDITYFPFDMQNCSLILGSRQSMVEEVHLNAMKEGLILLWGFSPNSQWQLMRMDSQIEGKTEFLSTFNLFFVLRRRPTKIVCNIFIPVIFLSIAANLVFLLPIDGGERMSTAVTILLAYAVYLTIVADSLPMNARTISFVEMYLLLLLGVATLIALANVIVVRMERKRGHLNVKFAKSLKRLQRLLCLKCCDRSGLVISEDNALTNTNTDETQNQMLVHTSGKAEKDNLTWSQAARLLDRILLILFSLATCLISVIFFGVLATGPKAPENNIITSDYPNAAT